MSAATGRAPRRGGDMLLAVAGLAAVLFAIYSFGGDRQVPLRQSPIGFDGLTAWLSENGQRARSYGGWGKIDAAEVGLRVMPLYDSDLDAVREPATTEAVLLMRDSEVDTSPWVVRRKLAVLDTVVVLHKWRTGMALTGVAHPSLEIDVARQNAVLAAIAPGLGTVVAPAADATFVTVPLAPMGASLAGGTSVVGGGAGTGTGA
ncbi:MAG: hypothetical protein AAF677_17135, partial [Pseudomonadota bacterium]